MKALFKTSADELAKIATHLFLLYRTCVFDCELKAKFQFCLSGFFDAANTDQEIGMAVAAPTLSTVPQLACTTKNTLKNSIIEHEKHEHSVKVRAGLRYCA